MGKRRQRGWEVGRRGGREEAVRVEGLGERREGGGGEGRIDGAGKGRRRAGEKWLGKRDESAVEQQRERAAGERVEQMLDRVELAM